MGEMKRNYLQMRIKLFKSDRDVVEQKLPVNHTKLEKIHRGLREFEEKLAVLNEAMQDLESHQDPNEQEEIQVFLDEQDYRLSQGPEHENLVPNGIDEFKEDNQLAILGCIDRKGGER